MNTNNDIMRAVANARRDDAMRWQRQEHQLKEAGVPRPSPRRGLMTGIGTLIAVCLAMLRKILAT